MTSCRTRTSGRSSTGARSTLKANRPCPSVMAAAAFAAIRAAARRADTAARAPISAISSRGCSAVEAGADEGVYEALAAAAGSEERRWRKEWVGARRYWWRHDTVKQNKRKKKK